MKNPPTDIIVSAPPHPYIDTENPQHFISLVPDKLRALIFQIPHKYFEMAENKLINEVYKGPPTETDTLLRLNFWDEYDKCFYKMAKMKIDNIIDGVFKQQGFYLHVANHPGSLAFIITEPVKIKNRLRYAYHLALQSMVEKLMQKEFINTKTGLPDSNLMKIKLDLFKYLDQRLHGSIVQKVEQKTLQVNVDGNSPAQVMGVQIPDNLDERLKELEAEISTHNALPPSIDVSTVVINQTMEEVRGRR